MTLLQSPRLSRHDDRRPGGKYVVIALIVIAAVGAMLIGGYLLFVDRGEILYLSDEPLPGQSGRIARHSIKLIDDPVALRQRVDEDTGAIIIPGSRIEELNSGWLAEQFAQGVIIVAFDVPARELAHIVGASQAFVSGGTTGTSEQYYSSIVPACDDPDTGGWSVYSFRSLRASLSYQLDRDRSCR